MSADGLVAVAEQLLRKMPTPRNPFGSAGELEHAVEMVKIHGEEHRHGLIRALSRVARQGGLTRGDAPFVWSEKDCTHHLDERLCSEMCERLLA